MQVDVRSSGSSHRAVWARLGWADQGWMFRGVWLFGTGQERGRVYLFGWETLGTREMLREEPEEIISCRI